MVTKQALGWSWLAAMSGNPEAIERHQVLEQRERDQSEQREALEELGRLFVRALRAGASPETIRRHRSAEARYYATYDDSMQERARKFLGRPAGSIVTEKEMRAALDHWRPARRAKKPSR